MAAFIGTSDVARRWSCAYTSAARASATRADGERATARVGRLTDPSFAAELARTLAPGGVLHLASDLAHLVDAFVAILAAAGLVPEAGAAPPPGRPTTAFERKYAQAGTYYTRWRRPGERGGSGSR